MPSSAAVRIPVSAASAPIAPEPGPTVAPCPSRDTLPELESLRGIAITLVVLVHAEGIVTFGRGHQAGEPLSLVRALMLGGHTGVSLFFILSGFLLSRPFLAEIAGGPRVDRATYARHRLWRIMPLYAASVVTITSVFANRPADLLRGLPYLVFLNPFVPEAMQPAPLFSKVWWSLATEAQFYVLLPLLPLAFRSRCGHIVGRMVAAAYVAAYAAFACGALLRVSFLLHAKVAASLIGRGPLFVFGIVAARVHDGYGARVRAWAERHAWMRNGGSDLALVATLLALATLLAASMTAHTNFELELSYPAWHVVEGSLWTSVVLLSLLAPLRCKPLLVNCALDAIGKVSYSVYLLHQPIMFYGLMAVRRAHPQAVPGWDVTMAAATAGLAIVVLTSAATTYALIERPMIAWGRRHGRRRDIGPRRLRLLGADGPRGAVPRPITLVAR